MHHAPHFHVDDRARLIGHLRAHPFVTLAAAPEGRPLIAHAPILVREVGEGLVIDFHLSRGNALSPYIAGGFEAVMVSLAVDAYVSPSWYADADQVPTWNYATVEAGGRVEAMDDDGLVALLDDLSAQEEGRAGVDPPWTRHKMSDGKFERMLRGIVGARMPVVRLEGAYKLSQNKNEADRNGVLAALGDHPIVGWMRAAG
jgi:transcriptional regulator